MQIQKILPNNLSVNQRKNSSINFNSKKIIDEGDYVKIPKKRYEREKLWEGILCAILLVESIICLIKAKNFKTPSI